MCAFGENMVGFTRLFTFLILCLLLWVSPANAGRFLTVIITDVTDGDSLRAGKLRLRLFGIDAPEIQQKCQDATSKTYACGVRAKIRMQELAPIGATLICEHLDTDRYKRLIVACKTSKGDIAEQLVADGLALAYRHYSERYVPAEMAAKQAQIGLWAGRFVAPWTYRQQSRN